jgi:hypothetical protein
VFAGGSYEEVGRWLLVFINSHAKRESPRCQAIVEAGDERAGETFGLRLALGGSYHPPLDQPAVELSYDEASAGKGSFPWCESLGKRVRGWAREMLAAERNRPGKSA